MEDKITLAKIQLLHPKLRDEASEIYKEIQEALTGRAICRFSHTLRTFEEQNALYAQGRTTKGSIVTNAKGGQSMHNYGMACFSEDTEILTDKGWRLFKYLDKTEQVLVFKDGELYYEYPKAYISNDYCGEMVSIQTRSVDLLVTPNHKMVVKKKKKKWDSEWSEIKASEIDYKYKIPTSGNFKNYSPKFDVPNDFCDSETWWEFMGWYLSEGCCCGVSDGKIRTHNGRWKVSISQKEGTEEWYAIQDCLDRMDVTYNYIGHEFIIHSKKLHSILFNLGNSHNKRIPRYLLNADEKHLRILLESLLLGDGTHYNNRFSYWTVSKELANDVSELMVLLGHSVTISTRQPKEHLLPHGKMLNTFNTQYAVNSRSRSTQEIRNGKSYSKCVTKEKYEGVVYCINTDAGAIVVKRNGKVSICGNCDIVLLVDKDKNGTFESASWETNVDFDGDGIHDWIEVVKIFKTYGWEWGGDWRFVDKPHFQKTFGKSVKDLQALCNNKKVVNGYVVI